MARFLLTYIGIMTVFLTLQMPTDDWSRGRILAASADGVLIRRFCKTVLAERSEEIAQAEDPKARELAQLKLEQLKARLDFALGVNG